jgi:hypothetical protein
VFSENPRDGCREIVDDGVCPRAVRRREFKRLSVPSPHQHSTSADGARRQHIVPSIADNDRARQIESEILRGPAQQPRRGLAAITPAAVLAHGGIRMVRAVIEAVEAGAAEPKPALDRGVRLRDERFGEEPAGDAGLVRDDDDRQAGPIEEPDRVDSKGKKLQALYRIELAGLLDERAVAIEKHCRRHLRCAPCAGSAARARCRLTLAATASTVIPFMQR